MPLSRGAWIGIIGGILGTLLGIGGALVGVWYGLSRMPRAEAKGTLAVRMDPRGPYVILASKAAGEKYAAAIAEAQALHPDAARLTFSPDDLASAQAALRQAAPRYALVFLLPEELDVHFAWRWFRLTTELDDDPLVDVRTGFVTGETPEAATRFVQRIRAAAEGRAALPAALVDNLGPNTVAAKTAFQKSAGAFFVPVFAARCGTSTISHGTQGFTDERLGAMDGAGLLHFGGHGHPDRIDDGLTGTQVRRLKIAPCVVFSGACYTGVTGRWYDITGAKAAQRQVPPDPCFCLALLANQAVAYLAAVHPDHGIPVYQEMEYLTFAGASLGDIIKYTHDGVVLASGAAVPAFPRLEDGQPAPRLTPPQVMRTGTAARVLFGDPALVVTEAFTPPPWEVALTPAGEKTWKIVATLRNTDLKSTFTDTYHGDLAGDPNLFNDRALITCDLPDRCGGVKEVRVVQVTAGGAALRHRLVGFAVETDAGARRLHVQVDVPTTGYMQSALRQAGALVELQVRE